MSKENRTRRRQKKGSQALERLPVVNPDAAGIDLGSREHYVSVPPDRDPCSVRTFGCYTCDLQRMIEWLKSCRIKTVAMESTGVYWVPVFEALEEAGIEACLVDGREYRSARKTDVWDSRKLRRLHMHGLLARAFRPKDDIVRLRSLWRHRSNIVESCSRQIHLMQKSLEQMNVQLHKVVSDIAGQTGMAILRSIVTGERDPRTLAKLRDRRCKLGPEEFVSALNGNFRMEHLFTLSQALAAFDFFQGQLQECDLQIQAYMGTLPSKNGSVATTPAGPPRRYRRKNQPHFDLRAELIRITGVDLTRIEGIDSLTAQTIVSECGTDVDRFPTEGHFSSWLRLCPNNRITGGIIRSRHTRSGVHRIAKSLRIAAQSLHRSQSPLGHFYRRMAARNSKPQAIVATANKTARVVYRMLKYGEAYVDQGQLQHQKRHQELQIQRLARNSLRLGFFLVNTESGEIVDAVS
jgi:transposase